MTISTLPTFPERTTDQDTFNTQFSAYNTALITLGTEVNAAAISMDEAATAAEDAAGVIAETKWISGTTYALGDVVWSPTDYQSYRRIIAGAGTTDPAADPTNWINITSKAKITRAARTSNTILGVSDNGKLIDITTGGFTQTFTAAATLAAGWWVLIYNSSSSEVLLEPNGAELIDGLTNYYMYAGECRLIVCTGTAFYSVIYKPFFQRFTSSFTFTKPPGYKAIGTRLWGAGGSGQRTNNTGTLSVGGGGGGCTEAIVPIALIAATESVTIGAGGAVVTTVAAGNTGGNTTFGSILTAFGSGANIGGGLSAVLAASPVGFEGGSATASPGKSIYGGSAPSSNATAASAAAVYGGAAGGSVDASGNLRAAGASLIGGSGGAAAVASNGTAGTVPGGGGGATQTGTSSGAGATGAADIWGQA